MESSNRSPYTIAQAPHTSAHARQTEVLLQDLQSIIARLKNQIEEVSQQLDHITAHPADSASQAHITTLRSLHASLQTELANTQADFHASHNQGNR